MSKKSIRPKDINSPDRILNNLIKDYAEGRLDNSNFLYRAVVVKIDHKGGELEEEPPNPKGSIRARVMSSNMDRAFENDEDLHVYWPLFPYDLMPVKEGEHVFVVFEDNSNKGHGLWISRAPENYRSDQRNLVPGSKKYKDESTNDFSDVGLEQAVQGTDSPPKDIEISDEFTSEEVPPFTPRVGDRVIEGSNNTLITLSRDRVTDPASR